MTAFWPSTAMSWLARLSPGTWEGILDYLDNNALRIAPRRVLPPLPDPGDTPFLEVALSEGVPLVTGNASHFPPESRRDCEVLSPGEFVRRYVPPESGGE